MLHRTALRQRLAAKEGASFIVRGYMKSAGKVKVSAAVQSFDGQWRALAFTQVGFAMNDTNWQAFSKTVTLPEKTQHACVLLLVEGSGKGWLDGVQLSDAAK